ncbi:MAG: 3-phosphoshikimate 1-carboxyvinyltransferase [Thermoanaerobacteraceae bacterium]|nr:3-phosphoshikimate 1-carboxyvinyltransferase [Thermoanaerobacteraceae bacterium]
MEMQVKQVRAINGKITVPGDKSISHRAVMLGALASGTTEVEGFLMGADCLSTVNCLRLLGVPVKLAEDKVTVIGCGGKDLQVPDSVLDTGNSGTTTRLLMGILASQPGMYAVLSGDSSLNRRPMDRVTRPLRRMGAEILGRDDAALLPVTVVGRELTGLTYHTPVASAQVKSAILLAGLRAKGHTTVVEPSLSRDHTERMLQAFGVRLERQGTAVTLAGGQTLTGQTIKVPGDISSAAFFMVAALVVANGSLTIKNVGINPTRSGIIDALRQMGAGITLENPRKYGFEEVADIKVESSSLRAAEFGGDLIPRMIDEIPALAVAALAARGKTVIRDAAELRVKESDRITMLARELRKLGAEITERPDGMEITGGRALTGTTVTSYGDHRLAMALAVAGLAARGVTTVSGVESVTVSFPGFQDLLRSVIES